MTRWLTGGFKPLPSLLHGLDVAVTSALETGRQLNLEIGGGNGGPDDGGDTGPVDELPEWGAGYTFVLYRRFVADAQSVLDLLGAVCQSAYEDESGL